MLPKENGGGFFWLKKQQLCYLPWLQLQGDLHLPRVRFHQPEVVCNEHKQENRWQRRECLGGNTLWHPVTQWGNRAKQLYKQGVNVHKATSLRCPSDSTGADVEGRWGELNWWDTEKHTWLKAWERLVDSGVLELVNWTITSFWQLRIFWHFQYRKIQFSNLQAYSVWLWWGWR